MIHFQLVSLSGVKLDTEAYEILLPTLDGQIGVMPGHMPLISAATNGVVGVRHQSSDKDDMIDYFAISGGVIEVADDTLRVLVDEADHADEISEAEAQKAYDQAQKMMSEAKDQVSLEHAQSLVDRSAVRLQVAGLKRRNRRQS
ncbi:MAG TPA: ATP synthase F1 subunit epsilon [Patescibacteria group bacterium]|nr:ATP synthase F1 subunit epsilon [Patescibacteria group bacterium]